MFTWIALGQVACCIASLAFTTYHDVAPYVKDYGHKALMRISTAIPHALTVGLAALAFGFGTDMPYIFNNVYAPAMFIKATLIPLTIWPDANPQCKTWNAWTCLTRNDMLPSGHMITVLCAALTLPPWAMGVAGLTGVTLVASRMHFSVDVILSCWLVYLIHR